jgi:phage terminase large subunit-like protein
MTEPLPNHPDPISVPGDLSQIQYEALLRSRWPYKARVDQLPPETSDWRIWLLLGGRGCGKTRAGAEWVASQVRNGARRIALVAPTYADGREVMVEGESGLLSLALPGERPTYLASRRRLEWPNGAVAYLFSSEDPEGLRGPQFDCAWADEFCAWTYPEATLSNLRLALRLGVDPKLIMTTTPKPTQALRDLLETPELFISRARTLDNLINLAPGFVEAMERAYGGTRLARQELDGEVVENLEDSLWPRELIEDCRVEVAPDMDRIVVAVDPPVTSGPDADACGLVVVGTAEGIGYVLHDGSEHGLSPRQWAEKAASLYEAWMADLIVVEVNQGGDMVKEMLAQVDDTLPVKGVVARRTKGRRAEPVAMLYEQGRVKHVGGFPKLEDEMNRMSREGLSGRASPDRVDALVWGLTKLMLRRGFKPTVRQV